MAKRFSKGAVLAALLGTSFQWFGCLGEGWWSAAFWGAVEYVGLEFVSDNDGVFDLFEDGNVAA